MDLGLPSERTPSLRSPETIEILGESHPYDGITDDGLGILSGDQIFWMEPVCFERGDPITGSNYVWEEDIQDHVLIERPMPRFGPRVVRQITFRVPNLTDLFPNEIERDWDMVKNDWRSSDFEEHFIGYPPYEHRFFGLSLSSILPDLIQDAQSQSLEEFRASWLSKELLWERHGTREMAENAGFRSARYLPLLNYVELLVVKGILPSIKFEALYPHGIVIFLARITPDRLKPTGRRVIQPEQLPAPAAQKIESAAVRAAELITRAAGSAAGKLEAGARQIRQVEAELRPTLEELRVNRIALEALMDQYGLKENPRQTRRALARHGVSGRIADFLFKYLLAGSVVPKAPTAARILQNRFRNKEQLDRKTIHRQFQIAVPILRAAGWPENLLPMPKLASKGKDEFRGIQGNPESFPTSRPTPESANLGTEPEGSAIDRILATESGEGEPLP